MQSFDDFAWNAAKRLDLNEPLRYAAQRLGELLDPYAHFAAAGSFTLDPVTALGEFLDLARAHQSSGGHNPSHHVMIDGVERTRAALVQDPNTAAWFGTRHRAAVTALDLCIDWTAAAAAQVSRKNWLIAESSAAARGVVRDLWAVAKDPSGGYRRRLVRSIMETCRNPSLATSEWLRFDDELRLWSAIALAEGRSDVRLGRLCARAIARSRDSDQAIERLRRVMETAPEDFLVALGLQSVKSCRNLQGFDLRELPVSEPQWFAGTAHDGDAALATFRAKHAEHAVVVARVQASDYEHASSLAWQQAERLADQYAAEHRKYPISVTEPVLALRISDGTLSEQVAPARRVHEAKARLRRPDERLEQSLRYAALARAERAPVVRVLHNWIALETLARGQGAPTGPYPFLLHHLAPALAVQAVRQSLASSWHIASRAGRRGSDKHRWIQLERWLGVPGQARNLRDLNRWVDLMRHNPPEGLDPPNPLPVDASLDEASAVFLDVLPTLVPFAREAILRWRWRLAIGNRLSNWCDEIENQSRATLGRMYVVRNSTVHTAITESSGGEQLAHAAANVVDAVYEVLPAWLVANEPTWRAFQRLLRRANHVHRTWNHLSRPALLNAEKLTRPGGDGLTR